MGEGRQRRPFLPVGEGKSSNGRDPFTASAGIGVGGNTHGRCASGCVSGCRMARAGRWRNDRQGSSDTGWHRLPASRGCTQLLRTRRESTAQAAARPGAGSVRAYHT
jgi:hypothetical protein